MTVLVVCFFLITMLFGIIVATEDATSWPSSTTENMTDIPSTTTKDEIEAEVEATKVKLLEFTYPEGSSLIPIAHWETKATLEATDLPESLTICTAIFLKSWVDYWTYVYLFSLKDEDDNTWAYMYLVTGKTGYSIRASMEMML